MYNQSDRKQLMAKLFPVTIIFLLLIVQTFPASARQVGKGDIQSFQFSENPSITENEETSSSPEPELNIDPNRIETFTIDIPQLNRKNRSIIVFLPKNYRTENSSYPVLYFQGAQDLFKHSEVSDTEWILNDSLYPFFSSGIEGEFILVGISSDPINYWDEYSPWVNDDMYRWIDPYDANRVEGGEGDAYLQFMIETLKPVIDSQYRTLPDQKNTAIGGYHMGGLISLYAGLTQPNVFSKVLAISPAVWFAEDGGTWLSNNRLLEFIETWGAPENVTFYLDIADEDKTTNLVVRPAVDDKQGEKISFPQAYLEGTRQVAASLIENGLPISNITGGIDNRDQWIDGFVELLDERELGDFVYFFPLFMMPPVPPKFTSVSAATFVIDHNNEFLITTESSPVAALTITGTLPVGVSFTDIGNGTATLSYTSTGLDVEGVFPIKIWADNGTTEPTVQYFELRIAYPSGLACPTSESCLLNFDMSMTPFLSRTRRIWVYLPPNYNTSGLDYQVMYIPDAQHIFGSEAGVPLESLWDWKFDETLDNLYDQTGKGTIIVGIEYDARYPWDEYSPWNNYYMSFWIGDSSQNFSGVGDNFLHFIVYELKPTIDSSYRTKPDRENTAIGGGSRCALLALYAGLREPDEFSKVMIFSPAVWLANNSTNFWYTNNGLKIWFDRNDAPTDVRYFLYVGTNEEGSAGGFYKDGVDYIQSELVKDGVTTSTKIVNIGGTHHPGVWAPYVDDALKYLKFY